MMRDRLIEQLNILLPAYINETLNPVQRKCVEVWLKRDKQAQITAEKLKMLQSAVQRQPLRTPPTAVFQRIQAQINQPQSLVMPPKRLSFIHNLNQESVLKFPVLLLSILTLILAAVVMWQALPPGIVLQWSVEGRTPEAFRVYRAEVESGTAVDESQFELLEEVRANSQEREYTFIDFRLLPGQNYVYRVEGLNESGKPAASQTISGRGNDALPGQLAILLVLIFTGYCFRQMLQLRRPVVAIPI